LFQDPYFQTLPDGRQGSDTTLSHAGKLQLTNMEQAKIRQALSAPIAVRKKFVKHLLLRLNVEVLDQNIAPYFPSEATIEHVLPQRPRSGSYWHTAFPDAKVRKYFCGLIWQLCIVDCISERKSKKRGVFDKAESHLRDVECQHVSPYSKPGDIRYLDRG
jgi:hypothetical protein